MKNLLRIVAVTMLFAALADSATAFSGGLTPTCPGPCPYSTGTSKPA